MRLKNLPLRITRSSCGIRGEFFPQKQPGHFLCPASFANTPSCGCVDCNTQAMSLLLYMRELVFSLRYKGDWGHVDGGASMRALQAIVNF